MFDKRKFTEPAKIGKRTLRKGRELDYESLPKRESMRKSKIAFWNMPYSGFNYNIASKYLESQVGKPWNIIYSDICNIFRGKYEHMRTSIYNIVDHSQELGYSRWSRLYVDDKGVLRKKKKEKLKKHKPDMPIVTVEKQDYVQHEGIWYRIDTQDKPRIKKYMDLEKDISGKYSYTVKEKEIPDIFGIKFVGSFLRYGKLCHVLKKEQANSREIRKIEKQLQASIN